MWHLQNFNFFHDYFVYLEFLFLVFFLIMNTNFIDNKTLKDKFKNTV